MSEVLQTDYVVIGAGVAGLRAAIELAKAGRVLVVAKDSLRESSSEYAQGGVAVALSDDDSVALHESDTLTAGDGLCHLEAVRTLVQEGPAAIRELITWGAEFDRVDGKLYFAREGAHSCHRVLHSHGDSTGKEIARALYHVAAACPNVAFRGFSAVADLLLHEGRVVGALALDEKTGTTVPILARAVLLATGGLGRVFAATTNPDVATGDGVAMAWRAGAVLSDLEFVQFHPTALRLPGAPSFLLSEALRGEGARLLSVHGERFMVGIHPMAELAPRDVVSRAIVEQMRRDGSTHVLLDLSGRGGLVRRRFPRIHATCLAHGIDLDLAPAPVCPAAHYAMGGVWTDLHGRTSLEGLWAAGEVACTGVHGANRLASNSLLEGIVFGRRAGHDMAAVNPGAPSLFQEPSNPSLTADVESIRLLASDLCGIIRSGAGLREAVQRLDDLSTKTGGALSRTGLECAATRTVVELIARCALAREESRGAHRRIDYPKILQAFQKHSMISRSRPEVRFE
ncbi:MAG: L-aspartate oxidase [Acidobacteria bacterium]|nr:L-aspartate oxidase [Acidobacteriota bacterium]